MPIAIMKVSTAPNAMLTLTPIFCLPIIPLLPYRYASRDAACVKFSALYPIASCIDVSNKGENGSTLKFAAAWQVSKLLKKLVLAGRRAQARKSSSVQAQVTTRRAKWCSSACRWSAGCRSLRVQANKRQTGSVCRFSLVRNSISHGEHEEEQRCQVLTSRFSGINVQSWPVH